MTTRNKRLFVWAIIGAVILSFIAIDLAYLIGP